MDADWDELARRQVPPPAGQVVPHPTPPQSLAFDSNQELLWVGNDYGRVSSYYGTSLDKYTSFKAHPASEGPICQILCNERGVIALGKKGVHMAIKRGPPLWPHLSHPDMTALQCMSFTSKGNSEILVAGLQDIMFVIDVNKGEIVKQIPAEGHYVKMKKSRYICAATKDGHLHILDPTTFKVVQKWRAHSAFISDMDARENFVITCGASYKQSMTSTYMLDAYVSVFDLRSLTMMAPIPFPPLAAYVRMHPRMVTTAIVVSQGGQMHLVDLLNPNTTNVRQANVLTYVAMVEIAPSGEAIALADGDCNLHLWGTPTKCHFVELPTPTEWPDEEPPLPHVDWNKDTPLNSIGMPYYREVLLSAWPPDMKSDVGAPPVKYDPSYLTGMARAEYGLYGRNTRGLFRNQVEDTRQAEKGASQLVAPKFLSDQAKEAKAANGNQAPVVKIKNAKGEVTVAVIEALKTDVPAMYQNVEIKYSKFGVDDFDFGFYNNTGYAGLENHIANSYANSLLQVLHFTPMIRNLALQHAATDCLSETCLLCELGFLSDMLQKAQGSTCQATNMLKCLSHHPQASPLGLLEEDFKGQSLTAMIQQLTRFFLDTMAANHRAKAPTSTAMDDVLATSAVTAIKCLNCKSETVRPGSTFVNDLTYPQVVRGMRPIKTTFSQVLKSSIEREHSTKGWCNRCNRYQQIQTRRTVRKLPQVLALNTQLTAAEHKAYWATAGWLPEEIGIIVDNGSVFCYQGEDLKLHLQRGVHNIQVYSLIGLTANIESGPPYKSHVIGLVNVGHSEPTAPECSQWHLFNDFSVQKISAAEALTSNTTWKIPSVVMYQLKSGNNVLDMTWKDHLDTSVLYMDLKSAADAKTYRTLDSATEKPGPETIIALDTEFVAVKQPEIEMNSEGERETIRPMTYALARVSVVRGQGADEGLPFIDDYISIKEPISDYLTIYSGITHGDLDPRTTRHNLVSLKIAYKRLWVLLNLGCLFLGHGLKQDFRVINIQVPQAQIIDTINLFFLKSRLRKLSLAFLAWYLLKEDIQLETHDSIEDARTALKLYRKYLEFEDAGILDAMLQDIYRAGRDTGFKPPRKDDSLVQRTDTPPIPIEGVSGPGTPVRKGLGPVKLSLLGSSPVKGSPLR